MCPEAIGKMKPNLRLVLTPAMMMQGVLRTKWSDKSGAKASACAPCAEANQVKSCEEILSGIILNVAETFTA